jgi:hypothetical protein
VRRFGFPIRILTQQQRSNTMGQNKTHKKLKFYSLTSKYDTEEKCKNLFTSFLWRDGVSCPHCKRVNNKVKFITLDKKQGFFDCDCSNQFFTIPTNWFLSGSRISYMQWLKAIENVAFSKGSISAQELAKKLEIGIKTARKTILIINNLVSQDGVKLKNAIEVDETYVGGIEQKKHMSRRTPYTDKVVGDKIPMFGMIERNIYKDTGYKLNWKGLKEKKCDNIKYHGKIVLQMLDVPKEHKVRRADVMPLIEKFSVPDEDVVFYHDANRIYRGESVFQGRKHKEIVHSLTTKKKDKVKDDDKKKKSKKPHYERYVKNIEHDGVVVEKINTNSVEGMFGQFKREIIGTHHSLSKKYIQSYADMFCFRWNTRGMGTDDKLSLLFQSIGDSAMTKKDIFPDGPTGRMTKAERKAEKEKQKQRKKLKGKSKAVKQKFFAKKKDTEKLRKEMFDTILKMAYVSLVELGLMIRKAPGVFEWHDRFSPLKEMSYERLTEFLSILKNFRPRKSRSYVKTSSPIEAMEQAWCRYKKIAYVRKTA